MKTSAPRIILVLSIALLSGMAVLLVAKRSTSPDWASAPPELQAILWPGARDIASFKLTDQQGQPFGKDGLKGEWSLLYFGYLQCPDICPTTLQSLSSMRGLIAKSEQEADIPRMIFVSVDPANDTPDRISGYLAFFDKNLIGLSGDPDQLGLLAHSLGINYAEHVDPNGVRSMEHTTSVIVVDPHGRGVAALAGSHQPRVMLQQFAALKKFLSR